MSFKYIKVKTKGQIEGEKLLVPKLRFKEFNNQWRKIKLKDISTDISYGMNSAATEYDGFNKYIRITDIDEETSLYNNNPVSPSGNLYDKFLVKDNDILFARTGASTGKAYLYNKTDGKLYFAGFLIRANIKKDYNSRFIFEQTKLGKYNNWVKIMSIRSGQPGINSIEYGNYEFSITHIDEQKKIANVIELVNKKIELQNRKIEALKIYKKGLMQKLINSNNCEEKRISEFGTIITGTTPSKLIQSYWHNGTIVWVTPSDITESKDIYNSHDMLTPDGLKAGRFVPAGSILITCIASIGKNAILKVDGSCNQQINAIIPNKNFNADYLYYLFELKKDYLQSTAGTSATSIINKTSFEKLVFKIHNIEQQNEYSKILNCLESKIETEKHKFKKLTLLKKSLLQQMFI